MSEESTFLDELYDLEDKVGCGVVQTPKIEKVLKKIEKRNQNTDSKIIQGGLQYDVFSLDGVRPYE